MTSAFDTIDRKKLIEICKTFLEVDDIKMIRLLLARTSLHLCSGSKTTDIETVIGTPQGDSLSPILFIIYLETALQETRSHLRVADQTSSNELIYADDVDFIFKSESEAKANLPTISNCLMRWNLQVNETKTEITTVSRETDSWKKVRKLGSLLDIAEDVDRRKILATTAFNSMYQIWIRRHSIQETRLIRLYNAVVLPILIYNSGTWGLTKGQLHSLETFHRKQLRRLLGIKWDDRVSNVELYARTQSKPLGVLLTTNRWRLFGHVLRRDRNIPAQQAMDRFFESGGRAFCGRRPTNLPNVLQQDLKLLRPDVIAHDHAYAKAEKGSGLADKEDLEALRRMASKREDWQRMIQNIIENS